MTVDAVPPREETGDAPLPPALDIGIHADQTTGYAAIQNNVPVVRSIAITNTGTQPLSELEVLVSCSPAFALGARLHFDRLAPGEARKIGPVDLQADHGYLSRLDEAEKATIAVTARCQGSVVAEIKQDIEVLAYDQWAGTRSLPELLAAFCMPNSRVIDQLIGKASLLLRQSPGEVPMGAYQSRNREHVWKQVSAIYSTLLAEGLQYANPPASFGADGQKIRSPERILEGRLGTCLDLAMLLAACFEQTGLNAVVLIREGHAWVGVWLIEACFPTALIDDVLAARKRVKSGELLVLEATALASAQKPSLRRACATGEALLDEDTGFLYAVDIRRARELQIRALPSRSATTEASDPGLAPTLPTLEEMPALPPLDPAVLPLTKAGEADTPEGRLARWKGKLLDLTLRNRLLNFKPARSNLRIICPDPAALEDSLSEGKEFRLRALPPLMDGADPREAAVFTARQGCSPQDALAQDALARREILADVPANELDGRLLEIYRAAATGLEEGGANTLYLAFGLLQWREEQDAEARCLAPILLVPVTLSRQSVRSGFKLTRHDDEALVNPTLLEKLRQDFKLEMPAFDTLPSDEKGLDVARILQAFRLRVGEIKGWEVKEQVYLGIFSFTKYLMWKDLQDRREQLQANRVVAQLINDAGSAFASGELGFEPHTLDETHAPQDLLAPLLADSSQLRAVCVASQGTDLVVEGPPGTGKSQTISNLIAHLLASGKTVLFVSEKMAALDVVHRRLNALGLGPFCLELHSAKAKKSDVLKQLGKSLEAAGARTVKDWELEAQRLTALRQDLNGLAAALHREHANDLTLYEAIGTCIQHAQRKPAALDWADADVHSRQDLDALRAICRQMAALAGQLTDIPHHPLRDIARGEWRPNWQEELLRGTEALAERATRLGASLVAAAALLDLDGQGLSLAGLAQLDSLAEVLLRAPEVPPGIARVAHDEAARTQLRVLRAHGLARQQAWNALEGRYREDVAELDATQLRAQWAAAQTAWWPRSWFARRAVTSRLGLYRADQARPPEGEIASVLSILATLNAEDKAIAALGAEAGAVLQEHFAAHRTDWDALGAGEAWAQSLADAVVLMAGGDPVRLVALRAKLHAMVVDNRAGLKPEGAAGAALLAYRAAYQAFLGEFNRLQELAQCAPAWAGERTAAGAIPRLLGILQGWRGAARQLQPWCLWQGTRARTIGHGLQGIVQALESGEVALSEVAEFFEYSYQNWWLRKAIDREPILCAFSSADHARKIREFQQADSRFQKLTEALIVARLAGQVPANTAMAPGADSEMGKLRRELQKQKRHLPIRQLVHGLPTLLPKLKPCLLMSPLSVAQYLDAGHAQFDVVVFDEASQIPVWDAVGAIARGRQLVCVGDPRQMPPTSFFNRVDDAEDAALDNDVQDLESILDECLSIGLPKLTLNWHYRSRHESLIAFSNATYYENRLITFPSPVTEDRAVRFERVQGVYDRGGSRTNRAEAAAIVAAIEEHYLDPRRKAESLGVVTFNQAQQNLIEKLLDARRQASTPLDQAIAQTRTEPLFIKNLENVQGDERDVIFFSVTYGPDAAGKVSLNFGPLNLEGGQRRLNVAVSRARQGVVIFSTLQPEQIDLARVGAAGVRDLKHYLEFAVRGASALVAQAMPTGREPDSPFEMEVIRALREKGWNIHPQVGVSGYRIDIGVVDPRAPGRYLLGVECDGRTYHSGATARDRDRLRQHVLEGLGWKLHRIWSTDWWLNPEEALGRLLACLEQALAEEARIEAEPVVAAEPADAAPQTESAAETASAAAADPAEAQPDAAPGLPEYRPIEPRGGAAESFYAAESGLELRRQLTELVNAEGPIADSALFRRMTRAWGLARTGKRIEELLRRLVPEHLVVTRDGKQSFFWPEHLHPGHWDGFRVAGPDGASRRAWEEICLEEIGNLALFILAEHGSTTLADLARSIARLQGIGRSSGDAEMRVSAALAHGRAAERVSCAEGMVALKPG